MPSFKMLVPQASRRLVIYLTNMCKYLDTSLILEAGRLRARPRPGGPTCKATKYQTSNLARGSLLPTHLQSQNNFGRDDAKLSLPIISCAHAEFVTSAPQGLLHKQLASTRQGQSSLFLPVVPIPLSSNKLCRARLIRRRYASRCRVDCALHNNAPANPNRERPEHNHPPSWTGAGYPYIALTTQVTSAARQWPAARLCCSSGASSLFQALAAKLKHPALLLRRHFLTDSIIPHPQRFLFSLFLSRQFLEVDTSSTLT